MVNVCFIDIYKKSNTRISKDTAGGYGTENLFGPGLVSYFAEKFIKQSVFWPAISFAQTFTELKKLEFLSVDYHTLFGFDEFYKIKKADIFFICNSIVCFETELELSAKLREKYPSAKVIFLGTIGEFLREKIDPQDYIVSGNYEFLFQNDALNKSYLNSANFVEKLFGIFGDDNLVRINSGDANKLSRIDWVNGPFPKTANWLLNPNIAIPYISTRGCPYSCFEYCTYPTSQGRKAFSEDIETTLSNLRQYATDFPGAHIIFRDPVFSINLKRTKMLLEAIRDEGLNLSFTAELHLQNLDDDFIRLASEANFKWFKFGIESAHENIRNDVNRHSLNNDKQLEKINLIRKYGIKANGMFILCLPTDTLASCKETIAYSQKLNLDLAQFSIFTPYPGTPFYKFIESEMDFNRYETFGQFSLTFKHKNFSKIEASNVLNHAYLMFYRNKIIDMVLFCGKTLFKSLKFKPKAIRQ